MLRYCSEEVKSIGKLPMQGPNSALANVSGVVQRLFNVCQKIITYEVSIVTPHKVHNNNNKAAPQVRTSESTDEFLQ